MTVSKQILQYRKTAAYAYSRMKNEVLAPVSTALLASCKGLVDGPFAGFQKQLHCTYRSTVSEIFYSYRCILKETGVVTPILS